jgi:predicted nucleic acid-binding protein
LTVAAFFLDTGTVLKRYVLETGTAWVQALVAPALRHSLFVVRITLAETVAAITRRERGGSITPHDAATAVADFQLDFARQYRVVEVSPGLVAQAVRLARRHGLRGYDAVQLAAVLEIHATDPSLMLGSADAELNTAALAEGLTVDDPNSYP